MRKVAIKGKVYYNYGREIIIKVGKEYETTQQVVERDKNNGTQRLLNVLDIKER